MKQILLFGAGKSATSLIRYLITVVAERNWQLTVAESNQELALSKIGNAANAKAIGLDVRSEEQRNALVHTADIVISLLPPSLHYLVAQSCLKEKRHLLTASYLDPSIREMEADIRAQKLLFLCEMGLDPGIDHMSAMQLIGRTRASDSRIQSFYSHTGGLIAPESDNNPWHYKISWNPRNVVLAGSAGASYKENGQIVTRPYNQIFATTGEILLPETGPLVWYPNRDSLSYIPLYGLEEAETFIRTTLRYPAFCQAWKTVVAAGLTDDKQPLAHPPVGAQVPSTIAQWAAPILPYVNEDNRTQLEFLGLFDTSPLPAAATAADVLQHLLETRLAMSAFDKDMIVMQHELAFTREGHSYTEKSTLVVKGEDHLNTAMAKTVGLPLGIAARLVLEDRLNLRGLHIPIVPEIYEPVLLELQREGIVFKTTLS